MRYSYKTIIVFLVFFSILINFTVKVDASHTFTLYYNGNVISDGIVHYQGDTATIGISGSITGFEVYCSGELIATAAGGTNYVEATLTLPSGSMNIYIKSLSDGSVSSYQSYNFYHDTIANPDATYTYASYEFVVDSINGIYTGNEEILSYVGEVLDQDEVNALFSKYKNIVDPPLTLGEQYDLSGWVRVRVFDSSGNPVGEYNCNNGTKVNGFGIYDHLYNPNNYNWSDDTIIDFYSRSSWSATQPFTEDTTKENVTGTLTVRHKDNSTHNVIAPATVDTDFSLPSNQTANINTAIEGYNSEPTSYMFWYGTDADAAGQTKLPYNSQIVANLDLSKPNAVVYYFYDLKPTINGRVHIELIDIDTNIVLSSTLKDNLTLPYSNTFYNIEVTLPTAATYEGANKCYSLPGPAASERLYGATAQTVELNDGQKEAWVLFYCKLSVAPTPTLTPTPTPTPTPDPRQPPNAIIESVSEVMMGDDISICSNSYDSDGKIVSHTWTAPTVKVPLIDWGNVTWFDYVGTATINLKVTDNDRLAGYASKTINILPPLPTAVITYTGRLKENYKITIDSVNSKSSKRYPIDNTKTVWKISAVSGCTDSDIKYLGTLTGMQSKDFLIKKSGRIKLELTVTNTAGYSNSTSILLDIQPNLAPVAQLYVPKRTLRENIDENGRRYGETTVYDSSYSPDGDRIIYRKYYRRYDSNNNGKFDDEILETIYEGSSTQATKRYYDDQAVGLARYDIYIEEDLLEKDTNGNYINTIPEFITPDDIKRDDTFDID